MQLQLSQKERMLLEDEKKMEEVCVQKYQNYAQQAQDSQLKQMFNQLATQEQHHYDTINQMLQGQQPNMSHGQQGQQGQQSQQAMAQNAQTQQSAVQGGVSNQGDAVLCSDLLATEKYVSGTYDTAVFEAANPVVRQALQHIQQEEQQHGQQLFEYMHSHGMYPVK